MNLPHWKSARALPAIALALAGTMATAQPAAAQATVVTFNSLTESSPGSGTRFVGNCYVESGFLFTAVGLPCTGADAMNTFVAAGPNSPILGGGATPSLLLNTPAATIIDVRRQDGAMFDFTSIMLAPFDGGATTVTFTGMRAGGNVTRTVNVAGGQMGFMMFSFADFFAGITGVQVAATNEFGEPLVKFDDFTAMTAPANVVPEPSTIVLLGTGLCLVLVIANRRRIRA